MALLLGLRLAAARVVVPSGELTFAEPESPVVGVPIDLDVEVSGDIKRVDYWIGSECVAIVREAPYTYAWTPDDTGAVVVSVYGRTTGGALVDQVSYEVTVALGGAPPPEIVVNNPGTVYEGVSATFSAATTGETVTSVDFYWSDDDGETWHELDTDSSGTTSWSVDGAITSSGSVTVRARAYAGAEVVATATRAITVGTRTAAWQAAGFTEDGDEVWDPRDATVTDGAHAGCAGLINAYTLESDTAGHRPTMTTWGSGSAPAFRCNLGHVLRCNNSTLIAHFTGTNCNSGIGGAVQVHESTSGKVVFGLYDATSSRVRGGTIVTTGTSFGLYRGTAAVLNYVGFNTNKQHLLARFEGTQRTGYRGNLQANTGSATGGAVTMNAFYVGGNLSTGALTYQINATYGIVYITSHPETIDWDMVEDLLERSGYGLELSNLPTLLADSVIVTSDAQYQGPMWDAVNECILAQSTVPKLLINVGDAVDSNVESEFHDFLAPLTWCDPTGADPSKAKLWCSPGNHELDTGIYAHYDTHLTDMASRLATGKRYGVADGGQYIDVIACDSNDITTGRAAQESWASSARSGSSKAWNLWAWHHRTYAVDSYVASVPATLGLVALTEANNDPIVFSGHTHITAGTVKIRGGVPASDGVTHVVCGKAAGQPVAPPVFTGVDNVVDSVIPRTDAFDRATSTATWSQNTPYSSFVTVEATATTLRVRLWHVAQKVFDAHRVECIYDNTWTK